MSSTPSTLQDLYLDLAPGLERVEAEIQTALRCTREGVATLVAHAGRYGGKRLRPALVLLACRTAGGGTQDPRVARLGAVVELVHLATLVHDDVIDGAGLRRQQDTINRRWSNHDAVLLGDVIFARAIHLLGQLGDERSLLGLTSAVSTLCEGEILQNLNRRRPDLSRSVYYEIIEAKTAILYAEGCSLAAWLAGAGENVIGAFRRFGLELGTAFQIVDDCLDLAGDEAVVGKSLGTDLENGKLTLPMILLREQGSDADRALLERVIGGLGSAADRDTLLERLDASGVLEAAFACARAHVDRGLCAVREQVPPAAARDLEAVAGFVLVRKW